MATKATTQITSPGGPASEDEPAYQRLVDNAAIGLYHAAPDGRITYANAALRTMLRRQTLVGVSVGDLFADPAFGAEFMAASVSGHETTEQLVHWRRADGRTLWVRHAAAYVPGRDGTVSGIDGTVADITARKMAEAALRNGESRLSRIVEANTDGILLLDLERRVTFANAAAAEIMGVTTDSLLDCVDGGATWRCVSPDGSPVPGVESPVARVLENGEAVTAVEVAMRHPDGRRAILCCNAAPLLDDHGHLTDIVLSFSDITRRKQAEEQLRESEGRLSGIVDTNVDGIIMMDLTGRITFANPAAERIIGVSHAEMLHHRRGEDGWTAVNVDGRPFSGTDSPFLRVMTSEEPVNGLELAVCQPSGRRVILSCNASPIRNAGGAVTDVVVCFTDITERKVLEERLTHQAFHDPLTGLPNRALFLDRLAKTVDRASRSQSPVGILFLDLDNFKVINDSLGHAMGDRLLVAVGRRMQRCLRAADTAARFGGDEFTVLIESLEGAEDATLAAARILEEMQRPFLLGTREVVVTPSIGVAVSSMETVLPDELLRNADAAMYSAKTHGKARIAVFESRMNTHALQRLEMETDLRRAIDRGEMVLHYQPNVALADGNILGVEALIRWNHPERGLIAPSDFIPLAEETGLIVPIGRWVLLEACRQSVEWRDHYPERPELSVGVNLSAKQFQDPCLLNYVREALDESGMEPHLLTLEITESVVMDEVESTITTLQALKGLGVRLAIDDFGTGYSSLSYLRRFPMDFVKIDRSFVDGLGHNTEDTVIVSATISLAHALGLTVVAEGTENDEQVETLKQLGCDIAQGFCFGRPVNSDLARSFLDPIAESAPYPAL